MGPPGSSRASDPAAPSSQAVSRRARPGRRLRSRVVRGSCRSLHAAGVRRRRHERLDGAAVLRVGVGLLVLRGPARLPRAARQASGALQRQGRGVPREPEGAPRRRWGDAVQSRPLQPEHRHPLRQHAGGEGSRRARSPDAPGPTGEGAPAARDQRCRDCERLRAGVHGGLQPPLRASTAKRARRAPPSPALRRPRAHLQLAGDPARLEEPDAELRAGAVRTRPDRGRAGCPGPERRRRGARGRLAPLLARRAPAAGDGLPEGPRYTPGGRRRQQAALGRVGLHQAEAASAHRRGGRQAVQDPPGRPPATRWNTATAGSGIRGRDAALARCAQGASWPTPRVSATRGSEITERADICTLGRQRSPGRGLMSIPLRVPAAGAAEKQQTPKPNGASRHASG